MGKRIYGYGKYLGEVDEYGRFYDEFCNYVGMVDERGRLFDKNNQYKGSFDQFGRGFGGNFDYQGYLDEQGRYFNRDGSYGGEGIEAGALALLLSKPEPDENTDPAQSVWGELKETKPVQASYTSTYEIKSVGKKKVVLVSEGTPDSEPAAKSSKGLFARIRESLSKKSAAIDSKPNDAPLQGYIRTYLETNGIAYGKAACKQLKVEYGPANEFIFCIPNDDGYPVSGNVEYNENGLVIRTACDSCAVLKSGFETDKLIMQLNSTQKEGRFAYDPSKSPSHIIYYIGLSYEDMDSVSKGIEGFSVEAAHKYSLSQDSVNALFTTAIGEMMLLAEAVTGGGE